MYKQEELQKQFLVLPIEFPQKIIYYFFLFKKFKKDTKYHSAMKLKKTWAFSDNTYINNKISKNLNTYRAADVNCITNQQEDPSVFRVCIVL